MTSTIGIPIKLLNEAQGHIVTLEITSGQTYRGKLIEGMCPPSQALGEDERGLLTQGVAAEDNMNVQLKDITVTARDGRVSHLEQVYIRGSHVRFFIVPDMLRYDFCPPFPSPLARWVSPNSLQNIKNEPYFANALETAGMRPCSRVATSADEELGWPAAGRRSAERVPVVGAVPEGRKRGHGKAAGGVFLILVPAYRTFCGKMGYWVYVSLCD